MEHQVGSLIFTHVGIAAVRTRQWMAAISTSITLRTQAMALTAHTMTRAVIQTRRHGGDSVTCCAHEPGITEAKAIKANTMG